MDLESKFRAMANAIIDENPDTGFARCAGHFRAIAALALESLAQHDPNRADALTSIALDLK